ncbi:MAG TPA: histidinol-phosphate transaminase, partial [Asticcacaulis sp.]|nr:histidinol-phosphate transaminase [Asticcacaulis sp.]
MTLKIAPAPKAGILDIAPYVGGKSKIEGVAEPIKLSSNENALGCSALAIEAYEKAKEKLFRYPDGHAAPLRAAV